MHLTCIKHHNGVFREILPKHQCKKTYMIGFGKMYINNNLTKRE